MGSSLLRVPTAPRDNQGWCSESLGLPLISSSGVPASPPCFSPLGAQGFSCRDRELGKDQPASFWGRGGDSPRDSPLSLAGKARAEGPAGSSPGSAQRAAVTPPSAEPAPERRRARHEGDCAHPGGPVREPDRYQGGPGRAFRSRGWAVRVAGLGRPRLAPRSQGDPAHSWVGTKPRRARPVSPRADRGIQPGEWATGPGSRLSGSGSKWATSPSCGIQRVRSGDPTRRVGHRSRRARPRELAPGSGPHVPAAGPGDPAGRGWATGLSGPTGDHDPGDAPGSEGSGEPAPRS